MGKGRLEAFSDGVIAILITIMVLELKVPHGSDLHALRPLIPVGCAYILSFVFLGIYWNNHHHMFHTVGHVNGRMLWANLHLLFWLSIVPFSTSWLGENPNIALPAAMYGAVLLACAAAYTILQREIIRDQGQRSTLANAVGSDLKGHISPLLYAAGIVLAFVHPWIAYALYIAVALIWLVPDRRIEKTVEREIHQQH
jgi:uncharacterized membrane protein